MVHDIGKPKTRTLLPGGRVAFHPHEVVGAAMTRSRLRELRFPKAVVEDVAKLVELHLRFQGYGTGESTDAAGRIYARDAWPLVPRLHALSRASCATRDNGSAASIDVGHHARQL